MKAVCDRSTLARGVQMAASIVPHRSPKPSLGCIKLEAEADRMTLLATDLEVGVRVELDKMEVQEPGESLIPADRLHSILRELDSESVTLAAADQEAQITAPGAHFKILGDDPADFPKVPPFPESGAFAVTADQLLGMIQRTAFATARENTRYALNGIFWEIVGTNLLLVATDGRRLSMVKGKCKDGPKEKVTAIVPSKAMHLLRACLGDVADPSATVRVAIGEKEILAQSPMKDGGRWTVYSRLVDGHFPKYDDVIPSDLDKRAVLKTEAFHAAVRKVALLTNEESRGVHLKFSPQELLLMSRTPEMGEAEVRIPIEYEGEELEIAFNPQFLTDALKVIEAEELTFGLKAANKPGVITEGRNFTHVVCAVSVV